MSHIKQALEEYDQKPLQQYLRSSCCLLGQAVVACVAKHAKAAAGSTALLSADDLWERLQDTLLALRAAHAPAAGARPAPAATHSSSLSSSSSSSSSSPATSAAPMQPRGDMAPPPSLLLLPPYALFEAAVRRLVGAGVLVERLPRAAAVLPRLALLGLHAEVTVEIVGSALKGTIFERII